MFNKQENKLTMYEAVRTTLQDYQAVVDTIPAMKQNQEQFNVFVQTIHENAEKQEHALSGKRSTKEQVKQEMIDLVLAAAGGLSSLAEEE